MPRLDLRDFDTEIGAIVADWRLGESSAAIWGAAVVGPLSLEIHHRASGSMGWGTVDARVGGGVQLWRSRNEQGVPLSEVIDGMRDYLRSLSEELAAACHVGGSIDG